MEFRNRHVVTRSRLAASGDACLLSCVGACSLGVPPFWVCVCVCVSYLTSGVMCSAEGRHATEPGTDYKTGRAELPTPILPYNSPDRRMTLPTDARTRMACPAVSFGPVRAREKGKRSW